jgi:hypothetical protein
MKNCCVSIPKKHVVKFVRNQAICTATQQVIADPILSNFTSFALLYAVANKKKHIVNQKFERLLCHKKIIHNARTLPIVIAGSFVNTNNVFVMKSLDVNFPMQHDINHGITFVLKIVTMFV